MVQVARRPAARQETAPWPLCGCEASRRCKALAGLGALALRAARCISRPSDRRAGMGPLVRATAGKQAPGNSGSAHAMSVRAGVCLDGKEPALPAPAPWPPSDPIGTSRRMSKTDKLLDDCFAHDKKRLRHDEALAILKQRVGPVADTETVKLAEAAGRILAAAAIAPHPIPAHTNAAVDGFSFAAGDYDASAGTRAARRRPGGGGAPLAHKPAPGTAARIFTGAVMPEGHDTVVMQEDVRFGTIEGRDVVGIPAGLKARRQRQQGRRGRQGRRGAAAGRHGAATAGPGGAGLDRGRRSACFARLKVGIVSTGDEVIRAGAAAGGGPSLRRQRADAGALIASAGAMPVDLGVFPDNLDEVKKRLAQAAQQVDVIITSGGASRGEEDHVVTALDALGKRHLWQLAIKPGRPMSFGQIGDCVMLGLPGNPVAVFVCFLLYVWPLLRRMGGAEWPEPRRYRLPALFAFPGRKVGRREFWRGILKETPRGLAVDKFARDGSGLISGLRAADGLIDIPEDVPEVRPGDIVAFIPFSEFGIVGR